MGWTFLPHHDSHTRRSHGRARTALSKSKSLSSPTSLATTTGPSCPMRRTHFDVLILAHRSQRSAPIPLYDTVSSGAKAMEALIVAVRCAAAGPARCRAAARLAINWLNPQDRGQILAV